MRSFFLLLGLLGTACVAPPPEPVLIAHRGNSSEAPENTLAAVSSALRLPRPPEFVEIDVRTSGDGKLVVLHDHTLERTTTGEGEVGRLHWDALRNLRASYAEEFGREFRDEPIPLLEEVLEVVARSEAGVMIEIKVHGIGDDVVRMLERRGELGRHVVASFYADVVVGAELENPGARTMYLAREQTPEEIELAHRIGAEIVGMSHEGLRRSDVDRAHSRGLPVWVWTVNDVERAAEILGWGADGIITDRPRAVGALAPLAHEDLRHGQEGTVEALDELE